MNVGFTGTRQDCTQEQWRALLYALAGLSPVEVHHGCAVGADSTFGLCCHHRTPRPKIIGHPSTAKSQTCPVALRQCDELRPALPPLVRNRNIVAAVEVLLACPAGMEEILRSGTWATIRHARKAGKRIVLIFPDGTTREENATP
jgi:hypothetical protein